MAGQPDKITGILLAGGKSSRMGREKGGIEIGDRTLLRNGLDILEKCCDEILVSTCTGLPEVDGYTQVCDEIRDIGPMGGVFTCLRYSNSNRNLVLSYDMPLVNSDLLFRLLDEAQEADLVVPALGDGWPEPLCAMYRKSTMETLSKLIEKGNYAMHDLYALVRTRVLRIGPGSPGFHPDLFLNVNRPEDLKRYFSILNDDAEARK